MLVFKDLWLYLYISGDSYLILMRNKKGQMTLAQLPMAVIIFAVAVIVTGIMATVLTKIQGTQTTDSVAYNITGAGLTATKTFSDFFDPIAVIVAAVVIIGLILGAFALTRGRSSGGGV